MPVPTQHFAPSLPCSILGGLFSLFPCLGGYLLCKCWINRFQASFCFVGSPSPGQHLITLVTSGWEWVMCGCQVCSSRPTDKASSPVIATLPLPTCSAFGSAAQNFTHFAQFCVWPLSKSPVSILHHLFFSSLIPSLTQYSAFSKYLPPFPFFFCFENFLFAMTTTFRQQYQD